MSTRRLDLPGDAGIGRTVADFVAGLAREGGLPSPSAYWLRLAVDELTTNVAVHGYRGGPGAVDLSGGVDDARVWVSVEDDAPAFDPGSQHGHDQHDADEEPHHGGYGLFLVLSKVDLYEYARVAGRNRSTVVMLRRQTPSGSTPSGSAPAGSTP